MQIRLRVHYYDEEETEQQLDLVWGASGLEAFVHVFQGAVNLMWNKNRLYGDAWRKQGYMGNLARIMSKTSRLKNMVWRDDEKIDNEYGKDSETIDDTLYDLINLAVFMLLNRGQGNRWGNDNESD